MQIPSKITKNNSQGIIFVIISCQRVTGKDGSCFGSLKTVPAVPVPLSVSGTIR